jgi:hypothetical protein
VINVKARLVNPTDVLKNKSAISPYVRANTKLRLVSLLANKIAKTITPRRKLVEPIVKNELSTSPKPRAEIVIQKYFILIKCF